MGRGGMGAVFLAEDAKMERPVAIKFLYGDIHSLKLEERFEREFRLMATLSHPNVATLYAGGRDKESGYLWYAMELVEGRSVDDLIEDAPVPLETVHLIVEQIADAFDYLHPKGIIHRDITPRNVLLTKQNRVVLVDFGLAKDLAMTAMTATGTVVGTPFYMSPEQFTGEELDGRSDIYQLGVVVYEMLTGLRPFQANSALELAMQLNSTKAPLMSEKNKEIPKKWDSIVEKCLQADRELRYRDGSQLLQALAENSKKRAPAPVKKSKPKSEQKSESSSKGPILLSLLAIFLLVFAGFFIGQQKKPNPCTISDFSHLALPGAVRLNWKTSLPCQTSVSIALAAKKGAQGPVSVKATKGATQIHELLITGLFDSTAYLVTVDLLENEKSLPLKVKTASLPLRLIRAQSTEKGLEIEFHGPLCKIEQARLSGSRWKTASFNLNALPNDKFILKLPKAIRHIEGISLKVSLPTGVQRYVTVTGLLAKKVGRLSNKLSAINARAFTEKLGVNALSIITKHISEAEEDLNPLTKPEKMRQRKEKLQKRKVLAKRISEKLAKKEIISDFKKASAIAPLVFEHKLLPEVGKERFYKAIMRAARLFIHFDRFMLAVDFTEPLPPLGPYSLQLVKPPTVTKELILLKSSEGPVKLGLIPMIRREQVHQWKTNFTLPKLPKNAQPALRLKTTSFRYLAAMAKINDNNEFLIFNRPLLPYEEDKKITLYQLMPRQALLEGKNEIRLSFEWVFLDVIGWSLAFDEIALVW